MGFEEDQRGYWESVAGTKTFTTPMRMDLFRQHVNCDQRILDLGCGYGRTLKDLHSCGYQNLCGVDWAEAMIARARDQCPYADLRVHRGAAMPFADGEFDAVIMLAVVTCVISDGDQEALMAEVRRILRPGGLLYMNDYLLNDDERNQTRYRAAQARYGTWGVFELPDGVCVRHHSEARVTDLVRSFETILRERIAFTTMNGNQSRGFCFVGRLRG